MTRAEMDALGWDSCDIIIVTGDAYVDHPSFGMAVIGRVLEAQGFRVGIIAQPDWHQRRALQGAGQAEPVLRRHRRQHGFDDQPLHRRPQNAQRRRLHARRRGRQAARPRRAGLRQRCREAFHDVPIVLGGIEASLRRIAHYDYWQDKVRRSILLDAKADLLLYGNAERAIVEIAHRLAARRAGASSITDVRGTAFCAHATRPQGWFEIDSTERRPPGPHRRAHQPLPDDQRAGRQPGRELRQGRRRRAGAPADGHAGQPPAARVQMPPRDTHRDPPADLRAGEERPGALRPRQPRAAPGDQPGQRARAGAAHGDGDGATCGSTRRRSR